MLLDAELWGAWAGLGRLVAGRDLPFVGRGLGFRGCQNHMPFHATHLCVVMSILGICLAGIEAVDELPSGHNWNAAGHLEADHVTFVS